MKHLHALLLLLIVAAASPLRAQPGLAQALYFDDAGPSTIVLGNSFYEVGILKANGAIAYITDKSTGQHIAEGSRYGCLWGAFGAQAGYVGGCSYSAGGASAFSYAWSAPDARLSLRYTPDPAASRYASALVTLTASPEPWFDLQLQLEHHLGGTVDYVLFPSDLVFREDAIQAVYLPVLPGVTLTPDFFAQDRSYVAAYPGELFADYMALAATSGTLAIYSLFTDAGVRPLVLGLNHDDDYLPDSSYYYHTFGARSPAGGRWESPPVRVRVGQALGATIEAFRADNRLDRFAPLATKAGARAQQLVRSPLLKADATQLALPFAQYADLLAQVPAPALLHLLAFQPGGFDEQYPDLLPPDPAWGSTADLAAMLLRARDLGFLTMPYINPTWWDDESPTLQALSATGALAEVVAFDIPGVPRYEFYGPHGGYVVSPHAPLVRQRLDQLIAAMTVTLPADLLFEDQVGARAWLFDHNLHAPSPTSYAQGWLDHTRAYSAALLMTEGGSDRLAETELGFHGSVLLAERLGHADERWGAGTWRAYPLAPLMLRDKVLFYQHNLAPETFTTSKAQLAWNMAFGYMLSFDLGRTSFGGGGADPWLAVVMAFQQEVLARYAGERMLSYTSLSDTVTRSAFERYAVITNWSLDAAYAYESYVLPPSGALVAADDGSLVAGVFTSYNGVPLQGGEHYLIEERRADAISVRQPMGDNTMLTIRVPPAWQAAGDPVVAAYSATGALIAAVDAAPSTGGVTFAYQARVAEAPVAFYQVVPRLRVFLPLVSHLPPA